MDVVMRRSDAVVVMGEGRVLTVGTPDEVRRDPRVVRGVLGAELTADRPTERPSDERRPRRRRRRSRVLPRRPHPERCGAGGRTGRDGHHRRPERSGKSTLVRVVIGLSRPWAGSVRLRGEDVTGRKPHAIVGRGVGYVAQRDNVFATMSVEENLELARSPTGVVIQTSGSVRCSRCSRVSASAATAGRDALWGRASDARARPRVDGRAGVLLLDEPSAGLSPVAVDTIFEKIGEITLRDRDPDGRAERASRAGDVPSRLRPRRRSQPIRGIGPGPPARPERGRALPRRRRRERRVGAGFSDRGRTAAGRPGPRAVGTSRALPATDGRAARRPRGRRRRTSGRWSTGAAPAGRSGRGRRRTTPSRRAPSLSALRRSVRRPSVTLSRSDGLAAYQPSVDAISTSTRYGGRKCGLRVLHGRASLAESDAEY